MTSSRNPNCLRKILLVPLCLAFGAFAAHAQNVGLDAGSVQQEIERLQRILELQREIEQLTVGAVVPPAQNQQGAQGTQGTQGAQGARGQQSRQYQQQYPQARQSQQPQQPQQTGQAGVSFRPVETGRSTFSFSTGKQRPAREHDRFALKMNLLHAAGLMAPNLGFDFGLGDHTSLGVSGAYSNWGNMWDFSIAGPDYDPENLYKRRLDHISAGLEFRYWFRHRFEGHFLGVRGMWAQYVVGETNLPPLFDKMDENEGFLYGGGLTYGYLWNWSPRWGMEFTLGAGVAVFEFDKRDISFGGGTYTFGERERYRKTYVGPTSAGITIVFKM